MAIFMMMRSRGVLGPVVKKTTAKPATVTKPAGFSNAGNYIVYKQNNP